MLGREEKCLGVSMENDNCGASQGQLDLGGGLDLGARGGEQFISSLTNQRPHSLKEHYGICVPGPE